MSLQTDLKTALSSVAGGRLFAQAAPEKGENGKDLPFPFIVYRVLSKEPIPLLQGDAGITRYSLAFECYGESYESALTTAAAVKAAIDASALNSFAEPSPGEEYIGDVDLFMEPVFVGIWHQ